jgi:hypothetical protein
VDNYIVRIYRREKDNPRVLVGLVEEVGTKGKRAFNDLDDLWEILNSVKRVPDWRRERAAHTMRETGKAEKNKRE